MILNNQMFIVQKKNIIKCSVDNEAEQANKWRLTNEVAKLHDGIN